MKKINFLIITILFCSNLTIAQSWNLVGSAAFSEGEAFDQCIVLDNETPYVAYMDRANGDKATVMKFNGNSWEAVGTAGFTPGGANSISFALNNGTPYVAFSDETNGDKATVMKFNGSGWVNVGQAGFSPGRASTICLTINDSIPYVAFMDNINYNKITVMKLVDGSWTTVGSPGFTSSMTNVISLVVDAGMPYVAYRDDDADYKASVMKFNGANWEMIGASGFSGGTHDASQCLAIYEGIPYVTSWDSNTKAAVYKYNGENWVTLGSSDLSDGLAYYSGIKFSNNGTLYLVFSDTGNSGKAILKKFDGSSWSQVGTPLSLGEASNLSIDISDNGIPYVVYRDHWNMRGTTVMKYSNATGITDVIDNHEFSVYPNPGKGLFTIKTGNPETNIYNIEIINSAGQVIQTKQSGFTRNIQIDLSDRVNGIYYIRIKNNQEIYSQSIVLNK